MARKLYTAVFWLLLPLYFLRLFWKGINNREYWSRWGERVGLNSDFPSGDKSIIWVHAVSVGEVNASMPLLRTLLQNESEVEILVTTTTPTGSKLLIKRFGNKIKHQYFPVDIPLFLNFFLKKWKPKMLILLETEIWPNVLHICKSKGIFTALVNARLSDKSKENYSKYKALITPAIESLDLILAQFESDRDRFAQLTNQKNISLCGNLKFDQDIPKELEEISTNIRKEWSVGGELRPTLIAASTHEGEEKIILDAFTSIQKQYTNALLILVPRHLERFKKVKNIINTYEFSLASRSNKTEITSKTKVLLGDTIGELNFLYSLADVAFIGGSLIDHGGQNLLEPSAQSLALLSGPSLRNFQDISSQLLENKGLYIVNNSDEISDRFIKLMENKPLLIETGRASFKVFEENRGALQKILSHLERPLKLI